MTRWYVAGTAASVYLGRTNPLPWLGNTVYLHNFHRGDDDRELHNHPWDEAVSIILSGGYTDQRLIPHSPTDQQARFTRRTQLRVGSTSTLRRSDWHRVEDVLPDTWTLFVCGKRIGDWGFLLKSGETVPWREFNSAKREGRRPVPGRIKLVSDPDWGDDFG